MQVELCRRVTSDMLREIDAHQNPVRGRGSPVIPWILGEGVLGASMKSSPNEEMIIIAIRVNEMIPVLLGILRNDILHL